MPTAIAARHRPQALSFAAGGLAWGLGLFALMRLPWVEASVVWPATRFQGQLATALSGVRVLPVDVTLACSGTDVLAMCLGAVLAYPARRGLRLAGAAGGLALILALNILRIATLGRAASTPPLFDVLHLYAWPAILALATAGYVFGWMRLADAAPAGASTVRVARPTRRFVMLTAALIVIFAAASPWYLTSTWVLATAGFIASAAALVLRACGVAALASGNLLMTARGGFTVTQECIATPLIPVYLAAVLAYVPSWRRRLPMLAAVIPIFVLLGIVRLLVIALPAALIGAPLFFIHAFYQLLMAVVVIVAAACWRHGAAAAWRPAAAGVSAGSVALAVLVPVVSRLLALAPPFEDPQGAMALLPPFQIALFIGLWTAAFVPAFPRLFAALLALIAISQAALFAVLYAVDGFGALGAHVPEVRAWGLAVPIACLAIMRLHEQPRD